MSSPAGSYPARATTRQPSRAHEEQAGVWWIGPGIYLAGERVVRTEIDLYGRDDASVEVYGPIQRELLLIP